jgi:penicillin-binding protein 1A
MRQIQFLLSAILVLALIAAFGVYGVYNHYADEVPDFAQLQGYAPTVTTRVQAGDGRLMAEFAKQKRVFVPIDAIPPRLKDAVLAAEDREFYSHGGVNPAAIARAMLTNVMNLGSGRRQIGASTITQQVAKNILLGNEYSYARKIKEIILAIRMDEAMSKDRILELYLNEIYFGRGAYGVAEAALTYFNKSLDDLTIAECAYIAALPKGPENYDPARHYKAAMDRRNYVIQGMQEIGAITKAEATAAEAEPIVLHGRTDAEIFNSPYFTEEVRRELVDHFGQNAVYDGGLSVRTSLDPKLQRYADQALRDGLIAYDRRHGYRGPVAHIDVDAIWPHHLAAVPTPAGAAPWRLAAVLEVRADGAEIGFVDGARGWMPMSEIAWARPTRPDQHVGPSPTRADQVLNVGDVVLTEAVQEQTAAPKPVRRRHKAQAVVPLPTPTGRTVYALRQIPNVSGAIVVMDPHTGRVLALSGGYSYEMSQFDRATQAYRQMGSSIKPFMYLAALDNGMTPSTMILDAPVAIEQGPGLPLWRPHNFESNEYLGPAPLRVAIEKSINTMTVRMASTIGIDKIAPYVERLGIMDKMPAEYSMVLGAGQTTPLRLTTAYAMLVNGGKRILPSLIDRVQDAQGKTIFRHDTRDCPRCGDFDWAAPDEVPDLPDEREQVIDPDTAYQMVNILRGVVQRGTAAASVGGKLDFPVAGKTGTTNEAKDTWFVGFTPDLVAGVYVGFDQPRTLGPDEQGAHVAAPIFAEFMGNAMKDRPIIDFRVPPGVRLVRVDPATGQYASAGERNYIWEAFKPGTEPTPDGLVIQGGAGIETLPSDDNLPMTDEPATEAGVAEPPGVEPLTGVPGEPPPADASPEANPAPDQSGVSPDMGEPPPANPETPTTDQPPAGQSSSAPISPTRPQTGTAPSGPAGVPSNGSGGLY